ncbi:MAG: HD domain-containing protein [Planctomycetes bacterium]|nr:HD domain-containing protein [Planctomycetota bacterium]
MSPAPQEPVDTIRTDQDLVVEIVDDLAAALVNARIYRADHPRVLESAATTARSLKDLRLIDGERGLRVSVANELLVHRGHPLVGASIAASRLIQAIAARRAGGLEIDVEADGTAIARLLAELAGRVGPQAGESSRPATIRRPEGPSQESGRGLPGRRGSDDAQPSVAASAAMGEGDDWQALNARLESTGSRSVRMLPPFVVGSNQSPVTGRTTIITPVRFYQSCIDVLQDVTISICNGGKIEFADVQSHAEAVLKRLEGDDGPLMNLARQDQYDAFTFGHSVRVAVLAMNFARTLTSDHELLVRIGTAALLHDCGKSLVPFEILHSRKPLGPDEKREMSKHPSYGAEILLDHDRADPLTIAAAFGHHRSCDGKGYPATLHEHHNLLVTEIVKVCDVYEALTAARPYKRPMSPVRAYRVMMSMGDHLDRKLLRRFIETNGIFPVGQLVLLTTGERARVVAQTQRIVFPKVKLETDPAGHALPDESAVTIDLSAPQSHPHRAIAEALTEEPATTPAIVAKADLASFPVPSL